ELEWIAWLTWFSSILSNLSILSIRRVRLVRLTGLLGRRQRAWLALELQLGAEADVPGHLDVAQNRSLIAQGLGGDLTQVEFLPVHRLGAFGLDLGARRARQSGDRIGGEGAYRPTHGLRAAGEADDADQNHRFQHAGDRITRCIGHGILLFARRRFAGR